MTRSGLIKNARLEEETQDPLSFEKWVLQRSNRIPNQTVNVERDEDGKPTETPFSYNQVIAGRQARATKQSIAVHLRPSPQQASSTSEAPDASQEKEDNQHLGLTEKEYKTLRDEWKETFEQKWQKRLEEEKAQVRKEAYAQGYQEASEEAEQQLEELTGLLTDGLDQVRSAWDSFLKETEPQLGELAFRIAEQVLNTSLPNQVYKPVNAAVHDAIDELAEEKSIDITLHPSDYLQLQESGLLEQLEETYSALYWHSDPEIQQRGSWAVETPRAAIRHMIPELLENIKQDLALAPDRSA